MDCSTQRRNSSLERHCEVKIGDEHEDIISQFPDGILRSIISFLPTKDAIRTSILSRRWQYMWTSLSNIDLDNSSSRSRSRSINPIRMTFFLDFVDRVLMLHDDSDIKRFRLQFYGYVNAFRVNSWVSAAVKHNCVELDLSLPSGSYALPCCLFTCQSLTVLKIEIVDSLLKVPTSVRLRSLKSLYLSSLTLETNCSSLFSSCPVLQQLNLENCEWEKIKYLTIVNPSLKSLTLTFEEELDCELIVYAASLTSFHYVSFSMIDVSILDAPSLVNAYVELCCPHGEEFSHRTIKLLGGTRNVKSLKIHGDTLADISRVENFLVHLPVFHNLTHLQVVGGTSCDTVMEFMQKTPNVETLSFSKVSNSYYKEEDQWILEVVVPCCLHSRLKTFSISCFNHAEPEMRLLKFVLKNAAALEMVKIECLSWLSKNSEKLELARKMVELLPRCSENCAIVLG